MWILYGDFEPKARFTTKDLAKDYMEKSRGHFGYFQRKDSILYGCSIGEIRQSETDTPINPELH